MKIYISHLRKHDFQNELYLPIKNSSLIKDHQFIFPHDENQAPFNSREIIEQHKIDLLLAEVSFPATGQGIELGWANAFSVPVLCIYKKDAQIAGSLKVITKDFIEYSDSQDLVARLQDFFQNQNG